MKKQFLFILSVLFFVISLEGKAQSYWTDAANCDTLWYNNNKAIFNISTPQQLAGLAYMANNSSILFENKVIQLMADIDLSAHYWKPISDFKGMLDGNGHSIHNLNFNLVTIEDCRSVGLFHNINTTGVISNLVMEGSTEIITPRYISLGVFFSSHSYGIISSKNQGLISNCYNNTDIAVDHSVSGSINYDCMLRVGGIAGYNSGIITNCYNTGNITILSNSKVSYLYSGGIAASNSNIISNSHNTGNIKVHKDDGSRDRKLGGITGEGPANNCFTYSGKITGNGTQENCYTAINATADKLNKDNILNNWIQRPDSTLPDVFLLFPTVTDIDHTQISLKGTIRFGDDIPNAVRGIEYKQAGDAAFTSVPVNQDTWECTLTDLSLMTTYQVRAFLVPDNQTPIYSPTYFYQTLRDFIAPTSHIKALPAETNDSIVTVSWEGTDDITGIKDYTIYMSEDGGDYTEWKTSTKETSADLISFEYDKVFSFFSIARDNHNNVEAMKSKPESTIRFLYIDSIPPVSHIDILPEIIYTNKVNISWNGKDDHHDVKDYTIYVSENDGSLMPWLTNTTDTIAEFQGVYNTKYTFFSTARDTKDNLEAIKKQADISFFMTEYGVIKGSIIDNKGTGISGVSIILQNDKHKYEFTSSSNGAYSQSKIEIGNYELLFIRAGFERISKNVTIKGGDNIFDIDMQLGWSGATLFDKDSVLGQRGEYPFAGIYYFDDLTIGDQVEITSSGISQLVLFVNGTLNMGKNATIRVRNGYYVEAPSKMISSLTKSNLSQYGIPYNGIFLFENMFGRGGSGGTGSNGDPGKLYFLNGVRKYGRGGHGGGGGAGGFGGGQGNRGGGGGTSPSGSGYGGQKGEDNGGNGGYGGANSRTAQGGGATNIGGSAGRGTSGGGAGGGGNGGTGGLGAMNNTSVYDGASGNGGGGGGYGGGILILVANKIVYDDMEQPKFLVSGQIGGSGRGSGSSSGQSGQGGLLIIYSEDYISNPMHWDLGNSSYGEHSQKAATNGGHAIIVGGPQIAPFLFQSIPTGADHLAYQEQTLFVWGDKGFITIQTSKPETVSIYTPAGMLIKRVDMKEGKKDILLSPGVYIVNKQKVIVK